MSEAARPSRRADLPLIGVLERVDIAQWGVRGMSARVDTGARTSALHVDSLQELGDGRVRFQLGKVGRSGRRPAAVEATVVRRTRVRSTSGETETRVFVTAHVTLGGAEHRIEVGLVDRSHMQHPMLLGRSALAGRFLVDPGGRYLLAARKR